MPNIRKQLNFNPSELWYLIGLIASDGCLSKDGRHIEITAKEQDFLEKLRSQIGLKGKTGVKNKGKTNQAYHIQISNKNFYEFLLSVGLKQRKSLNLGKIDVPGDNFTDFCRGVIDGDGNIRKWAHPVNNKEQWSLRIYSSSPLFLNWLENRISFYLKAGGRVYKNKPRKFRSDTYVLKYGKMAAKEIFKRCYYPQALALGRKAQLAKQCCRSRSGWGRGKAVSLN